jgi:hypothetical protein
MKLVIFLSFILNLKLSIAYFFKDKNDLKNNFDTFENQIFLEKSSALNKIKSQSLVKLNNSNRQRVNKQYKTKIYLLKDKDAIGEKPSVFKATVKLSDSLEIFENLKLTRKISFLE